MKLRWVAVTFTALAVYTALIGYYWDMIMSRFYETLSDPDMIYLVIGPQPIMALGFSILMVLFFYLLLAYCMEEYPKGGEDKCS